MRTSTFSSAALAAALMLTAVGVARAEHHAGQPPSDFVQKAGQDTQHHRRGEIGDFGAATKEPERPFPWLAVGLGAMLFLIASPAALLVYRSTTKDLQDLKTVGRNAGAKGEGKKVGPAGSAAADAADDATARDRVWEAVQSVNQWVPVDWVARTAGLSIDEATDELNGLAEDGQVEHANDRSGNPIFRAVAG